MISGDDPGARGVVKVVRYLASVPTRVAEELARHTAELSALEGDDDA